MRERGSWAVLDGMRHALSGQVSESEFGTAAGEDVAKVLDRVSREKVLQSLLRMTLILENMEKALDSVRDFVSAAAVTDRPGNGSGLPDAAANAEVVGIHHFAVDLDFLAFDANVRDPVLAATIGATGNVELELPLEVREALLEFLGEPSGKGFGFGQSEFAEFGAGAGNCSTGEGRGFDRKAASGKLFYHSPDMGFGNVDDEEVLCGGIANASVGIGLGKIASEAELRGNDA